MWVCSEEESANLPVFAEMVESPNTSKLTGRHNVFTHFREAPNCEVCKLTKTARAPGDRAHHPQKMEMLLRRITKWEYESRMQHC